MENRPRNYDRGRLRLGSRRGFTLIEIMVVMVLISVVTGIVYATFSSVVAATEESRVASEQLRLKQFLEHSFMDNLSQTYGDWRPGAGMREIPVTESEGLSLSFNGEQSAETPSLVNFDQQSAATRYWFQGQDDTASGGPADVLSFSTAGPMLGTTGLPGYLKQVTYKLDRRAEEETAFNDERAGSRRDLMLNMSETPILIGPDQSGGALAGNLTGPRDAEDAIEGLDAETPGWSVPIGSMDVQYYDGEEWRDEWDSTVEGRLPWSVHIRINFADSDGDTPARRSASADGEESADLDLIVSIPAGLGVTEPPHAYDAVAAEEGDRRLREGVGRDQ